MRAMILAAGRGQRMGALTDDTPKALLKAAGQYLIEYPLKALAKIGIQEIVINICYQREKIKSALGDGSRYGVEIHYSEEIEALETGGGIFQALPLLGNDPFIVLSCDVITNYFLQNLPRNPQYLAHIVLVDNPDFHPRGDFCLEGNRVYCGEENRLTFSNIGIYRPALFADCHPGKFRLGDVLIKAIRDGNVTGEHYQGYWQNLGTQAQLEKIELFPTILQQIAE